MKTYIVNFYKKPSDQEKELSYLGNVSIDDTGVTQHLTLMAKAFRAASEVCQLADKVVVYEVKS